MIRNLHLKVRRKVIGFKIYEGLGLPSKSPLRPGLFFTNTIIKILSTTITW